MNKKLHVLSHMFLKNPYVVQVTHPESIMPNLYLSEFRKMLTTAKKTITDTWGYSNPIFEVINTNGKLQINGQPTLWTIPEYACHSYWVFVNEMDALQFKITAGQHALRMYMWPRNIKFTITEYSNEEDINY